jgi:hypothetical protein
MEQDTLPDGSRFAFWECETQFHKTRYVDQQHPAASDDGPGSAQIPYRTIGRAAAVTGPGERVVIAAGIYRECVRPLRGGEGADTMVSYEAVPGDRVIISGAEVWQTEFTPSTGWQIGNWRAGDSIPPIWMGELPGHVFGGYNPFGMVLLANMPFGDEYFYDYIHKDAPHRDYLMRRGMLFVDGRVMEQVIYPRELLERPGTFWIEDDGLVLHFRLPDDDNPTGHVLEFTAREQAFTPTVRHLGWVRVQGLSFERVGNGIPAPQRGALSTNCGHHWIIEDCTVDWANTVGIDIGHQSHHRYSEAPKGYHIVRRNRIMHCGVCGLAGLPSPRLPEADMHPLGGAMQMPRTLIEDNVFAGNCWHNVEAYWESAAVKIHLTRDCLVRRNLILDNGYGSGLWMDFNNINLRLTGNVILNVKATLYGGIFVEASQVSNLVDNNIIVGVGANPLGPGGGGHGVYEHDCDYLTVANNLIAGSAGAAIYLNRGEVSRMVNGKGATGRKNVVTGNILTGPGLAIVLPNADNYAEGNLLGRFDAPAPLRVQYPDERLNLRAWRDFHGWDLAGREADVSVEVVDDAGTVRVALVLAGTRVEEALRLDHGFDIPALIGKVLAALPQ